MLIIKSLSFMLFIRIVSKICVLQNLRRKNELLEYLVNYVHTIVIIVVFFIVSYLLSLIQYQTIRTFICLSE